MITSSIANVKPARFASLLHCAGDLGFLPVKYPLCTLYRHRRGEDEPSVGDLYPEARNINYMRYKLQLSLNEDINGELPEMLRAGRTVNPFTNRGFSASALTGRADTDGVA